jgi:hypothetical protein
MRVMGFCRETRLWAVPWGAGPEAPVPAPQTPHPLPSPLCSLLDRQSRPWLASQPGRAAEEGIMGCGGDPSDSMNRRPRG